MKPTPRPHRIRVCDLLHFECRSSFIAIFLGFSPQQFFWNPASGLALALLTLLGPGFFPVVLAANLLTAFTASALPAWWLKLLLPVIFTANYTGMAWCVRRLVGPMPCSEIFGRPCCSCWPPAPLPLPLNRQRLAAPVQRDRRVRPASPADRPVVDQ